MTLQPGDLVAVEGVLREYRGEEPLGVAVVDFPFATDETGLRDGLTGTFPHVCLVHCCGDKDPQLNDYLATEGVYDDEDGMI